MHLPPQRLSLRFHQSALIQDWLESIRAGCKLVPHPRTPISFADETSALQRWASSQQLGLGLPRLVWSDYGDSSMALATGFFSLCLCYRSGARTLHVAWGFRELLHVESSKKFLLWSKKLDISFSMKENLTFIWAWNIIPVKSCPHSKIDVYIHL